jgi:hypothetical protein
MSAAEIRAELQDVELAWWPEFLLAMDTAPSDEDSFTVSLQNLAKCLREEESLA